MSKKSRDLDRATQKLAQDENAQRESARFRERLQEIVSEAGGVNPFSRKVGIGDSTIRAWLEGPSEPNRTRLVALADAAAVTVDWLATGLGLKRDPLRYFPPDEKKETAESQPSTSREPPETTVQYAVQFQDAGVRPTPDDAHLEGMLLREMAKLEVDLTDAQLAYLFRALKHCIGFLAPRPELAPHLIEHLDEMVDMLAKVIRRFY